MEYRLAFKPMSNQYNIPRWDTIDCDQILYEDRWVMFKKDGILLSAYTTDYIFAIELMEESKNATE